MTVTGRMKVWAWVFTAVWCAVTFTALLSKPAEDPSLSATFLAGAPWFAGCFAMMPHTTRRELLAWSFFYSALIFLGQAAVIYGSGWPGVADPAFLFLRIPLHMGIFIGLNLACRGLASLAPSEKTPFGAGVAAFLPVMQTAHFHASAPSIMREPAYCYFVLFALLAAVEVLSGKRVLLHRWFTGLALIPVSAMLCSQVPQGRGNRDSAGATAIETRAVERTKQRNLRFDFAFPQNAGKVGNGWGTVQFGSTAAMSREFEAAGNAYSVWADPVDQQRIRGEAVLPAYTLVAATQLAPQDTAVFLTPDLRCRRFRLAIGSEVLACQLLGPFPGLVEYRAVGQDRWTDLTRFNRLPVLPATLLSPFRYARYYIHEGTNRPVEVRVWRETARYVARFDAQVNLAPPPPASR